MQAAAEVALAKAQALEAAAKAADAAAIDAEEAAAMTSPSDTDNLGLPFLTLLKMVTKTQTSISTAVVCLSFKFLQVINDGLLLYGCI